MYWLHKVPAPPAKYWSEILECVMLEADLWDIMASQMPIFSSSFSSECISKPDYLESYPMKM